MGIIVSLITERGEVLEEIGDPVNHLHRFLPTLEDSNYTLANYIDWYGDTIFNRLQMPRFLTEWARLGDGAAEHGAKALHAQVSAMATRCSDEVHLYLRFRGD